MIMKTFMKITNEILASVRTAFNDNKFEFLGSILVFTIIFSTFDLYADQSHSSPAAFSLSPTSEEINRVKILAQNPGKDVKKFVESVIENGQNPNFSAPGNLGLLSMAIFCQLDKNTIVKLIDQGADVNKQDDNGSTPLMVTVVGSALHPDQYEYYLEIVKILLNHGANPNIALVNKQTALHQCCLKKDIGRYEEMIDLLLKGGADPNLLVEDNLTALHFAIGRNAPLSIIDKLLFFKANPNILANHPSIKGGATALHLAIYKQLDASSIETLLKNEADPNAINSIGSTPLIIAINVAKQSTNDPNIIETVKLLIKYGANTKAQNHLEPITKIAADILGAQHPVVMLLEESSK